MSESEKDLTLRKGYSPRETSEVKSETLSRIIAVQHGMMEKADTRTDLSDVNAVKRTVGEYFARCQAASICPSFEGICAACGVSRKTGYKYLREHPDSETTKFLEITQTELAAIRTAAADREAINPTFAIFQLLNSNLGFTNRHDVEFIQPEPNPLEAGEDVETVRRRYLEALPPDDE